MTSKYKSSYRSLLICLFLSYWKSIEHKWITHQNSSKYNDKTHLRSLELLEIKVKICIKKNDEWDKKKGGDSVLNLRLNIAGSYQCDKGPRLWLGHEHAGFKRTSRACPTLLFPRCWAKMWHLFVNNLIISPWPEQHKTPIKLRPPEGSTPPHSRSAAWLEGRIDAGWSPGSTLRSLPPDKTWLQTRTASGTS